ncbi:putidacin L1 family lectin-like bacteriocin [Pseudomonas sp. SC11]|uniref:putidacin L1 family lectin-like bacteriocin n=1 Tax=Pseudomonas sp. SC11 TaxID=326927 RepID=UPI003999CF9E
METNLRPFTRNGSSVLPPRTTLGVDQYLQSPNGRYKLYAQNDRNLALYDGANAVWVANASAAYSSQVYPKRWSKGDVSQTYISHELTVYDLEHGRIWHTVNASVPVGDTFSAALRTYLQLQDDGNIVIIDLFPVWYAPGSPLQDPSTPATIIPPGTIINHGDSFEIGTSRLIFQNDGNLVFYGKNNKVIWASYTQNKDGAFAAMQNDGQFVIYNSAHQPIWWTGTDAHPGAYARIQEDGSFAIVTDRVCWARFGFTPTIKPARKIVRVSGNPYTEVWKPRDYS